MDGNEEEKTLPDTKKQKEYKKKCQILYDRCRKTPWKDFDEFESVGLALLQTCRLFSEEDIDSNTINDIKSAFQRVSAWRARQYVLAHAVETTEALARLLWRDYEGTTNSTELRLGYSSAVLRGVNGLADILQQNRSVALSVSHLCRQLAIPAWLVDVRHESTHNALPTLAVLRKASKTMLLYLEDSYWRVLIERRKDHQAKAMSMLREYHETVSRETEEHMPDDDANSSSQSSSDEEDDDTKTGSFQNSFAALAKTKKKSSTDKKPVTKKAKKRNTLKSKIRDLAKAYVKADVPPEVGRQILLSCLVWSGIQGEGGVLSQDIVIPFHQRAQRYTPLLREVVLSAPGFYPALLIHLFDAVFTVEDMGTSNDEEQQKKATKLGLLESWVQYLLSRSFLNCLGVQSIPDVSLLDELKPYRIPLNALCDRCLHRTTSKPIDAHLESTRKLLQSTEAILGDKRVVFYGIKLEIEEDAAVEAESAVPESTKTRSLSLDEIEQMLDNPDAVVELPSNRKPLAKEESAEKEPPKRRAWVRCESWEPCSVGTLPGMPS